ncbi:MAG: N-acetylglucosamine-6-phosphate deacetylase [Acidobacteria bacterium]|nr:N-acetylglucosamine-6-phosphate deacetylase [Acidobacteriota bacterium]
MKRLAVIAGRVMTPDRVILDGVVLVEGTRIMEVGSRAAVRFSRDEFEVLDHSRHLLSPGFIDVHIHGAMGRDVMEGTTEALEAISRFLAAHGTTSFLATTVTASPIATLQAVEALGRQVDRPLPGARMLGLHLEGPFINPEKRGAHSARHIRPPSTLILEQLLARSGHRVKLITLAPEVEGSLELIRFARSRGVVVSLGHSNATLEETMAAIDLGAGNATHLFNAMRSFSHRDPGILGAVLTTPRIRAELIADGVHVSPAAVDLCLRCKGAGRILLISDAVSATGMPEGQYRLADMEITLSEGVCRTPDGTLAGSILTQDQALRNMVRWSGLPVHTVLGMLTRNPAQSLGIASGKGTLAPGHDADMVLLDQDLRVHTTIVQGEVSHTVG